MPEVRFPSNGGEATGYLAQPAVAQGPGVLVLQEWWGLDDHIRSVCDRLAQAGFFALAPEPLSRRADDRSPTRRSSA